MITKLFNYMGAETLKDKVIIVAKFIGMVIGCAVFLKLLQLFMWACYYAGVPM